METLKCLNTDANSYKSSPYTTPSVFPANNNEYPIIWDI